MSEIPTWWLAVSAAFFVVNILFFIAMIAMLLFVKQFMIEQKPRIEALESEVKTLVEKVHVIADRTEEIATSLKSTVDVVGGRAKGVATSAEIVASVLSRQVERFSPYIVGALTAMKLFKGVREMRAPPLETRGEAAAKDAKKRSVSMFELGKGLLLTLLRR
jgi:uncharacterized protein YoxC